MTKEEIVKETLAYYGEDISRRAIDAGGTCLYKIEDTGNTCALGRCFSEEGMEYVLAKGLNKSNSAINLNNYIIDTETSEEGLDLLLKPEYKGHTVEFWNDLQWLHDNTSYWKDSDERDQYVTAIIDSHGK